MQCAQKILYETFNLNKICVPFVYALCDEILCFIVGKETANIFIPTSQTIYIIFKPLALKMFAYFDFEQISNWISVCLYHRFCVTASHNLTSIVSNYELKKWQAFYMCIFMLYIESDVYMSVALEYVLNVCQDTKVQNPNGTKWKMLCVCLHMEIVLAKMFEYIKAE